MMSGVRTHKGFTIYQRGFLGGPNGKLRDTDRALTYDTTLSDIQWRKTVELLNQNAYNPNVVNLYTEMLHGTHATRDDAFLRALVKTTKEAFGTSSFIEWFLIQYESPDTGSMHIDFLEDVLDFLLIGTYSQPLYSFPVWLTVLNGVNIKGNETFPSRESQEMLNIYAREHGAGIDDFINAMFLKRNGVEQLVRTLYVLFGDLSNINHS
jgi:hypothetical protein